MITLKIKIRLTIIMLKRFSASNFLSQDSTRKVQKMKTENKIFFWKIFKIDFCCKI